MLVLLRSALFNVVFYLNLVAQMILGLPTILFGPPAILRLARFWARSSIWLLEAICGTRVEFRGLDRIPPGGLIVAAKHQSFLDVVALVTLFEGSTFVLKRQLTRIPAVRPLHQPERPDRDRPVARSGGAQPGRPRCRDGPGSGTAASHLPGRDTPPAGRRAALQIRGGPHLSRDEGALPARGLEFGRVLAEAFLYPEARHGGDRDPRADRAGARNRRLPRPAGKAGSRPRRIVCWPRRVPAIRCAIGPPHHPDRHFALENRISRIDAGALSVLCLFSCRRDRR